MGVSSLSSRSVRVFGGAFVMSGFLDEEEDEVVVGVISSSLPVEVEAKSLVRDGRVLSRSCWISLRESERPVPS